VESGVQAWTLTFTLALTSATGFMILRCRGKGRPFGRNSRGWAVAAILHTSVLSTVAAFVAVVVLRHLPPALLGIAAPSGLWLAQLRRDRSDRQHQSHDSHSLGLTWILARLHHTMTEDRIAWCERRVDLDWRVDQLLHAARAYGEYLRERLEPVERRNAKINMRLQAVEDRLEIVQLIENGASAAKVRNAMRGSRHTRDPKYARFRQDPIQMSERLRHDAEQDVRRMLKTAYECGCYRMPVFVPPGRFPWREPEIPERPHP
jgi:hypothetical protein